MTEPRNRRRWPRVAGIVLVVLVALVALAVLALDRILLSQVRKQTDQLSQELGRPVTVDGVATKLWGGLGVKVSGVVIGAGPGEDRPVLALPRAEVEADLWRAIRSGGSDVLVREAVVQGLTVNVVKLPDGTTNLQRLSQALEKRSAAQPKPAQPQGQPGPESRPTDLSRIRIDRAAVEDAKITFLDRTIQGAQELAVSDLDVEVRDLRAGQPLAVLLKAAVLAPAQNLELHVQAAPLPPTLVPTPERITLKVQPIDLGPLAPFLPASAGFRGGRFAADLAVALGSAVPGGKGRTEVKGGFTASQLAFAGQEGGKKLDASLQADLDADVGAGDLAIRKLDLAVGPAGLTGTGKVTGFTGQSPRVEGLRLVARGLDLTALQAYYPPLRKQLGGAVVDGPIGLELTGSGTGEAQTLALRADLGPVRLHVPDQLEKAAHAPASLVVKADASQGGGAIRYDATLDLAGVDLRPGKSLNKKPGDALSANAAGSWRKAGTTQEVALTRLTMNLVGDVLTGRAHATLAGTPAKPTTTFDAELSGQRLDLDRLLLPKAEPAKDGKGSPPGEAEKPLDPAAFAGVSGVATLKLGLLRLQGVEARDVLAKVRVQEDAVTFEEARLAAFGGTVDASGTEARLAHPDAPFSVKAKLQGVEGEQLLGLLSKRKVLGGKLDLGIQLGGKGLKVDPKNTTLTGGIAGNLYDGAFYGKDLVGAVAAPLAKKLPFGAAKVAEADATKLGKELPFAFRVENGVARLEKPLRFEAGEGNAVSLEGGVRMDGGVEMPATVALSPALIAKLTGGRVKAKEAIPVGFRLSGPAWSPRVEGLSLDGAVKAIVDQAAAGALGRALGVQGAGTPKEAAQQKEQEAMDAARKTADEARKKAEEDAKKSLRGLFGK
jgi:AsmA protein